MSTNAHTRMRPGTLSLLRILVYVVTSLPLLQATPLRHGHFIAFEADKPMSASEPTLWIFLAVAAGLVLLGGAFAGLTIALMGQDEIYLQVIKTSGEGFERKHATKVLTLLKKGKHWVLVTLLLGNVITNETLPIVLDRSLGGGWPAVLGSTVLIVIFGEIIPQSICVRYGLPIGAWMSPLVLVLMYILGPVSWPTAKLLDKLLGEDHGTTYKKAGLKTLVTLHKSLGAAGEQLNSDEVTIISAVLDLKAKPVGSIMTPIKDVFTMSSDTVLDEKTMDIILGAGYSRIPIHEPDHPENYVGMLLVKILITYDPEDGKRVNEFALATLPETAPDTSCLDIVNFFQEGKSHMVLVSEHPGQDSGAIGVVTLEDVIEELIGEEIIDESDVYIDVHKAIRRTNIAPKIRPGRLGAVEGSDGNLGLTEEDLINLNDDQKPQHQALRRTATGDFSPKLNGATDHVSTSKKASLLRRASSITSIGNDGHLKQTPNLDAFKNLGPSNLASRPRQTRYNTVKIKPGGAPLIDQIKDQEQNESPKTISAPTAPQGGVGTGLLNSAGRDASDGVLAVQQGYGTTGGTSPKSADRGGSGASANPYTIAGDSIPEEPRLEPSRSVSGSTVGSLRSHRNQSSSRPISPNMKRGPARSGSITENIVDTGKFRKVVLETTSSSDDNSGSGGGHGKDDEQENDRGELGGGVPVGESRERRESVREGGSSSGKKKRRRKRRRASAAKKGENEETTPLLDKR
ncbi:MAG: hypothetical protein LQ342_008449 [Letrouitia transgressa]|nr:MAG: hypothetical protein LQ342_008449 [Letrouitia transgressa]